MTVEPKYIEGYSEELNKMIKSLLEKNPKKRPEAHVILAQYYTQEEKTCSNMKKHTE